MTIRLVVNPITCEAHGLCAELFPERIRLDEWGYPIIDDRPIPERLEAHARRAAAACPTLASADPRRRPTPRLSTRTTSLIGGHGTPRARRALGGAHWGDKRCGPGPHRTFSARIITHDSSAGTDPAGARHRRAARPAVPRNGEHGENRPHIEVPMSDASGLLPAPHPIDPSPDASPPQTSPPAGVWRAVTLAVLVVPPIATVTAAVGGVTSGVDPRALLVAGVLYLVSGLGITAGFHRLFTHRAFVARRPLKIALAVAGSLAVEGSVSGWVANHRVHHQLSDQPGDPHSPWASSRPTGERHDRAGWAGFWHAHCLWLLRSSGAEAEILAQDVVEDRDLRRISNLFGPIALSGIVVPFLLGWLFSGSPLVGLWWAVWAGGVRIFVLHHVTWSINSVCHVVGRRPFATGDRSRNVSWLALASLGESWHNSHHQFPTLARHGIAPGQVDPTAWFIRGCEHAGLATRVRWPNERIVERARR